MRTVSQKASYYLVCAGGVFALMCLQLASSPSPLLSIVSTVFCSVMIVRNLYYAFIAAIQEPDEQPAELRFESQAPTIQPSNR
jgi:hypothetical protein